MEAEAEPGCMKRLSHDQFDLGVPVLDGRHVPAAYFIGRMSPGHRLHLAPYRNPPQIRTPVLTPTASRDQGGEAERPPHLVILSQPARASRA